MNNMDLIMQSYLLLNTFQCVPIVLASDIEIYTVYTYILY